MGDKRILWLEAGVFNADNADEKYTMVDANARRVEYKMSYNLSRNATERLFTWNELAKKIYERYTTISEKELKRIKELVSDAGIKENMTEQQKVVTLENYLKKNFVVRNDIDDSDAEDLIKVVKNKIASHEAFCKLFTAAFIAANVDFQIVHTGDRSDYVLDRNLENWNNARKFLFYFPATKKYLAPTEILYRYPWIPPTWANTNGLFCATTSVGGLKTAYAEIRNVAMEDYKHSYLNMEMKGVLNATKDSLELDVKQLYGGYVAPDYKAAFVFTPAEEQFNILKQLIKFGTNSENISTYSFENKELEQADPYKPFVIQAKVKSSNLIEKAGDKILIKVGELIGEQVEMYDAKERISEIELNYPHALVRTIELTIPDGYEVKNLQDLKFDVVSKENGKETMGFVCSYELKGNMLKITIKEDYFNTHYTLQQYPDFKKVINAAADFNKVTLVLEKKK
jgi:hypothetical protein